MKSRYFPLKALVILVYLASVGVTLAWVAEGWDNTGQNTLGADINAVAGATKGRTLIVVTNRGDYPWTDVSFVLNGSYAYALESLGPGEQSSVSLEEFSYTYAIPRSWDQGVWRDLATTQQPQPTGHFDITPTTLDVIAKEGKASGDVSKGKK